MGKGKGGFYSSDLLGGGDGGRKLLETVFLGARFFVCEDGAHFFYLDLPFTSGSPIIGSTAPTRVLNRSVIGFGRRYFDHSAFPALFVLQLMALKAVLHRASGNQVTRAIFLR